MHPEVCYVSVPWLSIDPRSFRGRCRIFAPAPNTTEQYVTVVKKVKECDLVRQQHRYVVYFNYASDAFQIRILYLSLLLLLWHCACETWYLKHASRNAVLSKPLHALKIFIKIVKYSDSLKLEGNTKYVKVRKL